MHIHILGYLILRAPFPEALTMIITELHSRNQYENTLLKLGHHFLLYFSRPCKLHIGFAQ